FLEQINRFGAGMKLMNQRVGPFGRFVDLSRPRKRVDDVSLIGKFLGFVLGGETEQTQRVLEFAALFIEQSDVDEQALRLRDEIGQFRIAVRLNVAALQATNQVRVTFERGTIVSCLLQRLG